MKNQYLEEIKSKGMSSPAGIHWDKFCKYIKQKSKVDDGERLLNPLILAASTASHADKYERLSEHLEWAIRHECIYEAIEYLKDIPQSNWNISRNDDWNEEFSWGEGEDW